MSLSSPYSLTELPPDLSVCPAVLAACRGSAAGPGRTEHLPRCPPRDAPPLSVPLPEPREAPEPAAPAAPPSSGTEPPALPPAALGGGAASVSRRFEGGNSLLLPWGCSLAPAESSRRPRHSPGSVWDTAPSPGCIPAPRTPGIAPRLSEDSPSVWD